MFLLLLALGAAVSYTSAQGLNEACTMPSGSPGVCRELSSCPAVAQFANVRPPKICGRRFRNLIVCCPSGSVSTTTCPNTGNTGGVPAPPVNFECGVQATRTVEFGDLLSRKRRQTLFGSKVGVGAFRFAEPAVVGGVTSKINAWPWMALLGEKGTLSTPDWLCAGALINDQWVLTAAHCFDDRKIDIVRLGEHDYNNPLETAHEDFGVNQVVLHPHYVATEAYHDLALMKLDRKVAIKRLIRPVCLPWNQPSSTRLVNSEITVTGWGRTEEGGLRSSTLQEVKVKVFPASQCHQKYSALHFFNTVWPSGINDNTLCAGDLLGGKDACQGDSGGPAVHFECNRYTLAGVISKGYGCGKKEFPGLYVNVQQSHYLQWIKQVAF